MLVDRTRAATRTTDHPVFWVSMGRVISIFCSSIVRLVSDISKHQSGREEELPKSLMFQTFFSAREEFRLFFLSFLTSVSVVAGGFSSDKLKPAMAESTLVKGADMIGDGN